MISADTYHTIRRHLRHYLLAILLVGAGFLLCLIIPEVMLPRPFLAFWPVVVLAAEFGGKGPGALATIASVLCVNFIIYPYHGGMNLHEWVGMTAMGVFVAGGLAISVFIGEKLKIQSLQRLQAAAVAASEARYRSLFEAANVGKSLTLPTGEIQVNRAFCDMLGYAPEDMCDKTWQALTPPEEIGPINEQLAPLLRGEKDAVRFEKRYIHKSGAYVWTDVSVVVQRDSEGKPLHFITTVVDIAERKRAEMALHESEERSRLAQDAAHIGTFDWDVPNNRITWSRWHEDMWGFKPGEFGGTYQAFAERVHPEDLPGINAEVARCIADHEPFEREFRVVWPDASVHWIQGRGEFIFGHDGQPLRMRGAVVEATARKQLETERQKFFLLAESSSEFIGMCDLDMNPLYVNPEGRRMVGLPDMAAACRVKVQDYYFPEDQRFIAEEFFPRVLREGHGDVEIRLRHFRTGEPIWMFYYLFSVQDASGTPVGWATVSRDITERRQAEAALRESEQRFASAFHTSPAAITITRIADGKFIDVNQAFLNLFEFNRDEVVGHTSTELDIISMAERGMLIRKQLETGGLRDAELLAHSKSGRPVHLLFSSAPMALAGEMHHVTTLIDITASKQAEAALRESEQEFRSLAEAMPQIVWACRPDGWNIYFNQQWVDYTGLTLEESYGHGWNKPFHPDDQQRAWDAWRRATQHNLLAGVPAAACRWRLPLVVDSRRADGAYRWWLIRGVPLRDADGKILKWFGTCTDIEDIKQAEQVLQQLNLELEQRVEQRTQELTVANTQLQELDKLKSLFIASMSHELRTPLNSIIGFTGIILQGMSGEINAEQRKQLGIVKNNAKHLLALINDIIDVSKIESGAIELAAEAFDLPELVRETSQALATAVAGKNLTLTLHLPPTLAIRNDRRRLKQILINLLDNAIKFTDVGEVAIELGLHESWIMLSVRDSGIGIDMQHQHRLFQAFSQIAPPSGHVHQGTGLGLYLSQKLAHLIGGEITLTSAMGVGSCFTLTLPYRRNPKS